MLAATKIIEDLRRENADLKAKLADSEAALHRFQHGQQIEGDYICEAAEKERAARLKAEAACAAKDRALLRAKAAVWDGHYGHGVSVAYAQSIEKEVNAALSTDAGQPILDYIAATRRLNDGVKLFIKVMAGEVRADKECPSFPQLVADVDAADAKLQGTK